MNLVERAKNIIVTPKTEWPVIASETSNTQQIMVTYILPLTVLVAIANIIGWGVIGSVYTSFKWGIAMGLVQFFSIFISIFIGSLVINALAPNFESTKDSGRAMQLVAYSYTPSLVGGMLAIFPVIGWIGTLFGIYGLYLLYLGLPTMMKTPKDKVPIYFIISLVVMVIVYWLIAMVLTSIFLAAFGLSIYGLSGAY
ncbi:MAG TPA: YIP1 family protein [Ignavibacteriaceae bacterium]|nr:YIP1 family protein [Ignavibacteriaceae bacterium]